MIDGDDEELKEKMEIYDVGSRHQKWSKKLIGFMLIGQDIDSKKTV